MRFICHKTVNARAILAIWNFNVRYFMTSLPVNLEGLLGWYIICHLDFTLYFWDVVTTKYIQKQWSILSI